MLVTVVVFNASVIRYHLSLLIIKFDLTSECIGYEIIIKPVTLHTMKKLLPHHFEHKLFDKLLFLNRGTRKYSFNQLDLIIILNVK